MKSLRVKHTLTISTKAPETAEEGNKYHATVTFFNHLVLRISQKVGGCFRYTGTGYWSEDATENKEHYNAVYKENAFRVEFTHTDDISEWVKMHCIILKDTMRNSHGVNIPIEWVDMNIQQVEAKHFKI